MPKSCIVPKCKTGYKSDKSKRSVFRMPKDPDLLKKWIAAIPGNVKFEPSHCVCDKHFNDEFIIREWIKTDRDGNIIAKVAYKYPQLSKIAVPTKFDEDMEEKAEEEKAVSALIGETKAELLVKSQSAQQSLLPSVIQKPAIWNSYSSASDNGELLIKIDSNDTESSCIVDSSTANIPLSVVKSCNDEDIADNEDPAVRDDKVHLVPEFMDCGLPLSLRDSKVYTISPTAVTFSQQVQKLDGTTSTRGQYSATIPRSWTAAELRTGEGQCVVFSRTIMKIEGNNNIPILLRSVTLDANRKLEYFVYGRRVNRQGTVLNEYLEDAASLSHTLELFARIGICNGLCISNNNVPIENAFLDYLQQWRHNDCTLISKRKRCESCMKLRKRVNQRIKSMTSRPTLKRIRQKASNPFDQCKIAALLKRSAHERRKKLQAQGRVNTLTKALLEEKDLAVA